MEEKHWARCQYMAGEQSFQAFPDTHVSGTSLCSSTRMLSKPCTSGMFGGGVIV